MERKQILFKVSVLLLKIVLNNFCVIATISIDDLTECLQEQFRDNKPPLPLIESLFQRFRPLKVGTGKEGMDRGQGIEQG